MFRVMSPATGASYGDYFTLVEALERAEYLASIRTASRVTEWDQNKQVWVRVY